MPTFVRLQSSFPGGRVEKIKFYVMSDGLGFQNSKTEGALTLGLLESSRNLVYGRLAGHRPRFPSWGLRDLEGFY